MAQGFAENFECIENQLGKRESLFESLSFRHKTVLLQYRLFVVQRILPAMPIVPKSFSYEWKKYPPFDKIEVGLPTTTKNQKEESSHET